MDSEMNDVFDVIQRREKPSSKELHESDLDESYDQRQALRYVNTLASMTTAQFSREADRLADERSIVLEQTKELAYKHYKTFVSTSRTGKDVQKEFRGLETKIEGLLEDLPRFSNQCQQFSKEAQAINVHRRLNSLTLSKHTELLEILELAQLMESCVRNGCFEEALELAAYVRRMEIKHGNIPIIASIVAEVQESLRSMLNLMISQLRGPISLPQCLRVIGFIRQTEVFSEPELRIKFLQARNTWFTTALENIDRKDAYYFITKCVELHRVHLFDILTQYRAIFSEDDHHLYGHHRVFNINHGYLLSSWVIIKMKNFLNTLESAISDKELEGRLDSILSQCMYFGLSLSRIGCDFRSKLGPIFAKAALGFFQTSLQEANERFRSSLQTFSLIKVGTPMNRRPNENSLHPPLNLLEFFPLAEYCNLVLQALNTLRLCCPLSLIDDVSKALSNSLETLAKEICEFHRREEQTFTGPESDNFLRFVTYFVLDLAPFLARCCSSLFPASVLAPILGRTAVQIKNMKLGMVSLEGVFKPIQELVSEDVLQEALSGVDGTVVKVLDSEVSGGASVPQEGKTLVETPTVSFKIQEAVSEEEQKKDVGQSDEKEALLEESQGVGGTLE